MFVTASVAGSYLLTQSLSETVFFDKFIYGKSIKFGYTRIDGKSTLAEFGKRASDLVYLGNFINNEQYPLPANVLGATANDTGKYTVVILGDSFVWGQGLQQQDRFPVVLEKKLNTLFPAEVISLARQGDGLFDNYAKYELARYAYPHADLFVFGVVDNDITLLGPKNSYSDMLLQSFIGDCGGRPFLFVPDDPGKYTLEEYYRDSYSNYCVLESVVSRLPRNNAVYFDYDDKYFGQFPEESGNIPQALRAAGLVVLSAHDRIQQEAMRKQSRLYVSPSDSHPSKLANNIFAEVLFEHIQSLRWKSE